MSPEVQQQVTTSESSSSACDTSVSSSLSGTSSWCFAWSYFSAHDDRLEDSHLQDVNFSETDATLFVSGRFLLLWPFLFAKLFKSRKCHCIPGWIRYLKSYLYSFKICSISSFFFLFLASAVTSQRRRYVWSSYVPHVTVLVSCRLFFLNRYEFR